MSSANSLGQRDAVLFGLAGGMLVVASALAGSYYVITTRSEARAATPRAPVEDKLDKMTTTPAHAAKGGLALDAYLSRVVEVKTAAGTARKTWADLGVEIDTDELARVSATATDAQLAALGAKGSIPVRIDRTKAVAAVLSLKGQYDKAAIDAHLDLEARKVASDSPGQGIDVWATLPRVATAARQGAASFEVVTVPVPARVTKEVLGIDDISHVLGHYTTKFAVADKDRNFNLKLAASKINGLVLKPGEEWSFNGWVGERSQATGYKVAHVITAGEMVDGLAGGTCQISTTLFGAAFFAGLEFPSVTNHSRPSTYTPLGFDATVAWPHTDFKLKNPYDFPVAVMYRVANGQAYVEVLGKQRPYTKVQYVRELLEESPFGVEERLDEEMPLDQTMLDQPGFNGYKMRRYRRFYKGKKMVREQKWVVSYKPVTEYVRRGTNPDPAAQMPKQHDLHPLKPVKAEEMNTEKLILIQ
jgi:vancomycin resistance protein YoaR